MKVHARSFERYRATAKERREHGGATVTRFYVYHENEPAVLITGYGPTPSARKADAIAKYRAEKGLDP